MKLLRLLDLRSIAVVLACVAAYGAAAMFDDLGDRVAIMEQAK